MLPLPDELELASNDPVVGHRDLHVTQQDRTALQRVDDLLRLRLRDFEVRGGAWPGRWRLVAEGAHDDQRGQADEHPSQASDEGYLAEGVALHEEAAARAASSARSSRSMVYLSKVMSGS